jgi:hypothetical protein
MTIDARKIQVILQVIKEAKKKYTNTDAFFDGMQATCILLTEFEIIDMEAKRNVTNSSKG